MSDTAKPSESVSTVTSANWPIEKVFAILSTKERQLTTLLLTNSDRAVTIEELVAHIESEIGGRNNRQEEISIKLCHRHLPKLEEEGVIEYSSRRTITRGPEFEQLIPALNFVTEYRSVEQGTMR